MLFPTFLYLLFAVTTFANPVSGPKKVLEKRSDAKGCDCPRMNGDCFIWAQFLVYPNGETSTKIPVCTSASDNTLRYVCQNTFDEPNCVSILIPLRLLHYYSLIRSICRTFALNLRSIILLALYRLQMVVAMVLSGPKIPRICFALAQKCVRSKLKENSNSFPQP